MTDLNLTADSHKALKAALDKLKASTDSVMLTPLARQAKDKEEKRFILQAKSFFGSNSFLDDEFLPADAYVFFCLRSESLCDDWQYIPS